MIKSISNFIFYLLLLLVCFLPQQLAAQEQITVEWTKPVTEITSELKAVQKINFVGAFYTNEESLRPVLLINKYYNNPISNVKVQIQNLQTTPLSNDEKKLLGNAEGFSQNFDLQTKVIKAGKKYLLQLEGIPLIEENGVLKKVTSFTYEIRKNNIALKTAQTSAVLTSPLKSGTWYKFGVVNTGVQQIPAAIFSALGIDISKVNPKNIRVFGNSEGLLPESNTATITETLQELSIFVNGESDGVFNASDYILFYGKGPHTWEYNSSEDYFNHRYNIYGDTAYYFVNFDQSAGKRIGSQAESSLSSTKTVTTFDDHQFHEVNNINVLKSGKIWLGEYFDNTKNYSFNFSFPNISSSDRVKIKSSFAVRSFTSAGNNLSLKINNSSFITESNILSVSSSYTSRYAREINLFDSTYLSSSSLKIDVSYNKPQASSVAWLDYLSVNAKRKLSFSSGQLAFRSAKSVGTGQVSLFTLSASRDLTIWDVSNPLVVKSQNHSFSGGQISFKIATAGLKEFVAFDGTSFQTPSYSGKVSNQNILANVNKEYLLICPPQFLSLTKDLASFHQQNSNLSTAVVTTNEVFNEFASGIPDPTAIRNYMRYLYNNSSTKPKYLLLMGDASYDYKNIDGGNGNIVPAFQSDESYHPLSSFTSDDYFGMLDDVDPIYSSNANVDIGIGRFPGKSALEVSAFIEKVKNYVNSSGQNLKNNCSTTSSTKATFGSWKNSMLFVADDGNSEDNFSNSHLLQTEMIIESIESLDSTFNIKKVYLDAYKKEAGPGGGKYPEVTREINNKIQTGALAVSYIGHGGEAGWADERILEISDIDSWTNFNEQTLFLTATCEFSRYDNPSKVSAGEKVILNPNGGAIALLTTVRLVFGGITNNIGFSINFFKHNLTPENGKYNTLGDAVRLTKIESSIGSSFNNRKFVLLGDPAVALSLPKYKVITTGIFDENGLPTDTIKALSKVKVQGKVLNPDSTSSTFNGIVFPTVYDVYKESITLNNNNTGISDTFNIQNNIIFKGKATVKNGNFDFEFIVPKDISYSFKNGKVSYYVANKTDDGNGFSQEFKVGGTASNFVDDRTSPTIDVFLNDSNFVNGGLTNESPNLIVNLSDASGINTSGGGIGHDIVATLDGNLTEPIVLNDYYEANIDDYTGGVVNYQLSNLEEGQHTLKVKAWDVYNNSSESSIEFVVSNSSSLSLDHVLNYPNPFSTSTHFYFEHNHACSSIDVQVKVFTISGKIVKTINQTISGSGNLKGNGIHWDGRDDYGDKLARGVYLYQLEVQTSDGFKDKKIEKLVILN